jgi:hypothetical protein
LTAGGRYEKSTEDVSFNSLGFFSSGEPYAGSASGSKFTPRFALSYDIGNLSSAHADDDRLCGTEFPPIPAPGSEKDAKHRAIPPLASL